MTESIEILRMNIQHYEGLLRLTQESSKRQQIEKLLAETRAALESIEKLPLENQEKQFGTPSRP